MKFPDLGLGDEVLKAVEDAGYITPTPIQTQAIPYVLMGRDILGCAQTGTGKTASFTLPMIDVLASGRAKARMPRTLILEPTRELAAQVAENFDTYGKYHKLTKALLIGGSSMDEQMKLLDRGVDVLIATPGRLLDMYDRGRILMNDIKILVIDEADRMLDMGFIPDVERIVSLISKMRQTLFFSATMPPEIKRLADAFLMNPKEITVSRPATTAETITQGLVIVPHGDRPGGGQKEKRDTLRKLIEMEDVKNAIVFCNRKRDVSIVYKSLTKHGYNAGQLHGDMVQSARMETLDKFKANEITILVCSDVAARGLDINNLSHVYNYDVPTHADDYVHRIGRTGRAGKEGHAYTIAVPEDGKYLDAIAKKIGKEIPRLDVEGLDQADLSDYDAKGRRKKGAKPAPKSRAKKPDEEQEETNGRRTRTRTRTRTRRNRREDDVAPTENVEAVETNDVEAKAREERNPRNDNRRSNRQDNRQDHRKNARSAAKADDDKPKRERKPKSRRDSDNGPKVKGMGDHMPAFMKPRK